MTDSSQPMFAYLTIEPTGQIFPLEQELVTIGRKSGNTIVLEDDLQVSRHHATIVKQEDRFFIQDVGSANGTFLNHQRLTEPQPLHDGDLIRMGDTIFTVHFPTVETRPSLTLAPAAAPVEDETIFTSAALEIDTSMVRVGEAGPVDNPYVGPRTFTQRESDRFFGREREAQELLSLVISERLTLFYAQSGAGKSSLLNARLVPQLRATGFPVLPIGRVSGGQLPAGVGEVDNIFCFNLLLSLDESDGPPARFAHMSLSQFLSRLTSLDGQHYYFAEESAAVEPAALEAEGEEGFEATPYVLIIDQFEELFTAHPDRWQDRADFFKQLDQAMNDDPLLWVVLTIREDYVANLDPFTHLIPGNLRGRFYMQRMDYQAALEAIQKPAEQFGRPFAPGVAENLVDNLRQIRVGVGLPTPGEAKTQLGQFVEPVQLQVVCYQLWENLKDKTAGEITQQDLQELGDVDKALAQFYEQAIGEAVEKGLVSEIEVRNWFETQLITEAGTRGTVYRGATDTGGLPNPAVDLLVNRFLLRAEVRSGGTWYELIHDRLVQPILQANQVWSAKQPLIQMAQAWFESERSINKLLDGQQLQEALATDWQALGHSVEEFITASREAEQVKMKAFEAEKEAQRQRELEQAQALAEAERQRAEEQARASRRFRLLATGMAIITVVAITAAIVAVWSTIQAQFAQAIAAASQEQAEIAKTTAEWNQYQAAANEATADAERATAQYASTQAVEQQATAEYASTQALDQQAAAMAAQETAIYERDQAIQSRQTQEAILVAFLTAQASADTPTPTATATGTATPAGPRTPEPPALPTYTATPVPTPTPDQVVQAAVEELANLRATQTVAIEQQQKEINDMEATRTAIARQETAQAQATATPTPTATSEISCLFRPEGEFSQLWADKYRNQLGCPTQAQPTAGFFAEQPFQNGFMFWTQELDEFIVFMGNQEQGIWRLIEQGELTNANEGIACNVGAPPSPELTQPIRGFGSVWCQWEDIRERIGWGTAQEYGVQDRNLWHKFEKGLILRASNGAIYILVGQNTGDYFLERP